VEGKLHFTKKKIAEKIIETFIMFFIPYYCADMQDASIFMEKNFFLFATNPIHQTAIHLYRCQEQKRKACHFPVGNIKYTYCGFQMSNNKNKDRSNIRLIVIGITTVIIFLVAIILSILSISRMEALKLEIADLMAEGKLISNTQAIETFFIIRTVLIALGTALVILFVAILLRNSAERKKAEERMLVIFNSMPFGANIHNDDFSYFECNESALNLFGLSGKQEYLDKFFQLSPEYQPDGILSSEKMAEFDGKTLTDGYCRFEWTHRKLNGELIPCEIILVRVNFDNEFYIAGYIRDLTELKQRERLLNMVNNAAGVLLSISDEKLFETSLLKSLELVGSCMDIDRLQIWCNEEINGELHFVHRYEWLSDYGRSSVPVPIGLHFPYSSRPEWESLLNRGEYINSPLSGLPESDRNFLNSYGMKSIVIIPMFVEDNYWGFFSIDDCRRERKFSDEEVHILASVGLMMSNAVERNIQNASVREADERTQLMLDSAPICAILWGKNLKVLDCNQEAVNMFRLSSKK